MSSKRTWRRRLGPALLAAALAWGLAPAAIADESVRVTHDRGGPAATLADLVAGVLDALGLGGEPRPSAPREPEDVGSVNGHLGPLIDPNGTKPVITTPKPGHPRG